MTPRVADLRAAVYRIPTDRPEADGAIEWNSTTLLLVEAPADTGESGLGYSYCAGAAASVVCDVLRPIVCGTPLAELPRTWIRMVAAVRNIGRQGIAATAIAAVDIALWDLRARLEGKPVVALPHLNKHAIVQGHCHHKAVLDMDAEEAVLHQLGLDFDVLDSGCCGMAGAFGDEFGDHYAVSVAAGERVVLPAVRSAQRDTLVVADGFSCREQIAQCTDRRALHLADVVQMALRSR